MTFPATFSLAHLGEVMEHLSRLHKELAHVRCMELDHKVRAWEEAEGSTVTERREYVQAQAASCTRSVWELEGDIAATQLELDYLLLLRQELHHAQ